MQIADEREAGRNHHASQQDVQRNNESLANTSIVFTTQESLDAFRLVIEQLSQFYKTSAKVTAETIQYTPDSTYKAVQEEWTRIEGSIQSKLERIIQETHAVEEAAQEMHPSLRAQRISALQLVLGVRQHRSKR